MTHYHRRGVVQKAKSENWQGWSRFPCTETWCDWAMYVDPKGRTHVGYIPSPTRPGNVIWPGQVHGVATVTEVGTVDTTTGEIIEGL